EAPADEAPADEAPADEARPKVHRKREGTYEADSREPLSGSPSDHSENRRRRAAPSEDLIPELPEDLFNWPEPRRETRPKRPEDEDPPHNPNGPSHP
ncbi:MAG: hypothetical protein H0X19_14065, partial [Rubrobacter sp.]|nr:hypothetical protein [Rubrobacter sp.]